LHRDEVLPDGLVTRGPLAYTVSDFVTFGIVIP
jgi:hypothetical protein